MALSRLRKHKPLLKRARERTPLLVTYDLKMANGDTYTISEKYLVSHQKEIRKLHAEGAIIQIQKRN